MNKLKWIAVFFYLLDVIFLSVGLIYNIEVIKFIGFLSLGIASILTLIKLIILRKK